MRKSLVLILVIVFIIVFGWLTMKYFDCVEQGGTPVRGVIKPIVCFK